LAQQRVEATFSLAELQLLLVGKLFGLEPSCLEFGSCLVDGGLGCNRCLFDSGTAIDLAIEVGQLGQDSMQSLQMAVVNLHGGV
jgi:hypothetical protein